MERRPSAYTAGVLKFSNSQRNSKIEIQAARGITGLQLRLRQLCVVLTVLALWAAMIIYTIHYSSYEGLSIWDQVVYVSLVAAMSLLFLYLDARSRFHHFHRWFEQCFGGRGQIVFTSSLIVIGFIDFLLIEIHYRLLSEGGGLELLITLYVLFYLCLLMAFCTFMTFWDVFAYYCAESPYMHGFMYLTVIGGLILFFARWIRPGKEGDWHYHHGTDIIIDGVLRVISFFFVFLVVLAGIGIALFSEFGQNADKMGTPLAFTLLAIISMVVLLTPLAPGNIVDVCGGFVIVQILREQEGLGFWTTWAIALAAVCIIHFCGACAQWYIGMQPCVQAWGNRTLPVPMLAASDAVLKEADCFRVGLIGYVFMDTANGLNQGRINMAFWTQLLSEWACIPNAIPLVSLGATVAVSGDESFRWTALALPVLLLLATCWQMLGTSFGANAMGTCSDGQKYWTSREKWITTQQLNKLGYSATKLGWKNDVYQLAKVGQTEYESRKPNKECLYNKIVGVHETFLEKRAHIQVESKRVSLYEKYCIDILKIRTDHIVGLTDVMGTAVEVGWVSYTPIKDEVTGWFDLPGRGCQKKVVTLLLVICYWTSIYGIYNQVYMQEAVRQGVKVLDKIQPYAWVASAGFIVLEIVYFHIQICAMFKKAGSLFVWICGCCKTNPSIETRFDTPKWNKAKVDQGVILC